MVLTRDSLTAGVVKYQLVSGSGSLQLPGQLVQATGGFFVYCVLFVPFAFPDTQTPPFPLRLQHQH